jgi:hypothetical protein
MTRRDKGDSHGEKHTTKRKTPRRSGRAEVGARNEMTARYHETTHFQRFTQSATKIAVTYHNGRKSATTCQITVELSSVAEILPIQARPNRADTAPRENWKFSWNVLCLFQMKRHNTIAVAATSRQSCVLAILGILRVSLFREKILRTGKACFWAA